MLFDSIVGIFLSFGKLGIAIWLLFTYQDKLIVYGLLFAILIIVDTIIKATYCCNKYKECEVKIVTYFDSSLFKEMFSFAGWNTFGALSGLGRNQGLAIILNLFYGVIVNAAFGIAVQINGLMNTFSANLLKALNPQIVNSEGAGKRNLMIDLSIKASKFSFFLISFFAIPLIFEMPFLLKLWLIEVPDYSIIFCQLILIMTLINHLSIGLQIAVQSIGKIKLYQTVVGGFLICSLPISYFLLKLGMPVYSPFIAIIIIEIFGCYFRIYYMKKFGGLSVIKYLKEVILKISLPLLFMILICMLSCYLVEESLFRFILTVFSASITNLLVIYFFGLSNSEKVGFYLTI